jgi:hypothetical protein
VNGRPLEAGLGFFATVNAAEDTLWLTLNGRVEGPITLDVE